MATSVRLARSDDLAFIDALGMQTALDTVSPIRSLTRHAAEQAYQRLVSFCRERTGTVTFVAECEGRPAGFLILVTDLPDDVSQPHKRLSHTLQSKPSSAIRASAAR